MRIASICMALTLFTSIPAQARCTKGISSTAPLEYPESGALHGKTPPGGSVIFRCGADYCIQFMASIRGEAKDYDQKGLHRTDGYKHLHGGVIHLSPDGGVKHVADLILEKGDGEKVNPHHVVRDAGTLDRLRGALKDRAKSVERYFKTAERTISPRLRTAREKLSREIASETDPDRKKELQVKVRLIRLSLAYVSYEAGKPFLVGSVPGEFKTPGWTPTHIFDPDRPLKKASPSWDELQKVWQKDEFQAGRIDEFRSSGERVSLSAWSMKWYNQSAGDKLPAQAETSPFDSGGLDIREGEGVRWRTQTGNVPRRASEKTKEALVAAANSPKLDRYLAIPFKSLSGKNTKALKEAVGYAHNKHLEKEQARVVLETVAAAREQLGCFKWSARSPAISSGGGSTREGAASAK